MINTVVVEGLVIRAWTFAGDGFYRIASYRDPGLPPKLRSEEKDAADFMTFRIPKGSLGGPVSLEVEDTVRVHGFVQSRDYEETLAEFVREAKGPRLKLLDDYDARALRRTRVATEIVAERIVLLEKKRGNQK
ncbi:MAG: hypothetical protein ABSG98_00335 [Anaerolineales bacterium]|jgi:hypothetical protein